MSNGEKIQGYLVVKVLEAADHNSDDVKVWDPNFTHGFVKIEIRGGARTVKKQTSNQKIKDGTINWEEQLALECLDGASELRILLCREKKNGDKQGTSIVAACGIYMKEILEAVPIDKYFELFKPGHGAEGGFIRVSVNYLNPEQVRNGGLHGIEGGRRRKGGFPFIPLFLLAAAGGGAYYYKTQIKDKEDKKKIQGKEEKKGGLFGKK